MGKNSETTAAKVVFEMLRQSATTRGSGGLRFGFLSERVPHEYREGLAKILADLAFAGLVDLIVEDRDDKSEAYCFLAEKDVLLARRRYLVSDPDDAPGGPLQITVWRSRPYGISPGVLSAAIGDKLVSVRSFGVRSGFLEIVTADGRSRRFEVILDFPL